MALCGAKLALLIAGAPRVGGTVLGCATTHSPSSTHIEQSASLSIGQIMLHSGIRHDGIVMLAAATISPEGSSLSLPLPLIWTGTLGGWQCVRALLDSTPNATAIAPASGRAHE